MNQQQNGFTLIELIFMILIIGILAAVAMPKWSGTSLGLEFEARRVLNDVRFTQIMSMSSGERYRWVQISANSYAITNEAGAAIVLPSGGTAVTFSSGVQFGGLTNLPSNLIAFSALGVPFVNTTIPGTALASTAVITITSGAQSRSISITPVTGYGAIS